jgi:hypothetical protein
MCANCLPNVSVAIHVNGNALHEYHADSEDAKTALCYVEAVSCAKFSLALTVEPDYTYRDESLHLRIFLDGNRAHSGVVTPAKMTEGYTASIDSALRHADGFTYHRKFTFAQHEKSTCHIPICHRSPANVL